ncbi:DUF6326 family protein [Acaryochloris marina]|uniref:DUF6326 family protein n=1 Tax=Acaryochloris marina TaxID=155978 RepID=UPI0021C377EB|nr:DUF6326 family protein [Acaryochloris marina]BDM83732.1 hypothetical protein AM10699_65930 [Acaryochloris marina MBIC10699]
MNMQKQILAIETKAKLSTLWLLFLLNIIFRDIHEFIEPGFVQEIMTGTLNGNPIQEHMLLLGGIMLEIPITMIFLSWVLPYRANRRANIIVAAMYISIVVMVGTTDLDDSFHLVAEIAALSLVIFSAVRWRNPSLKRNAFDAAVSS